ATISPLSLHDALPISTNIGGTTPNKPGIRYPDGVARLLRGNSDIILQMHYTTNGKATSDRTRVGIIYAAQPPSKLAAGGMVLQRSEEHTSELQSLRHL